MSQPQYKLNWLGYIATVIGPIALTAEIIDIIKHQSTEEISWLYVTLSIVVSSLWLTHSIVNKITPSIIYSCIIGLLFIVMLILKIIYTKKKKYKELKIK